jgi:hypothetical protein
VLSVSANCFSLEKSSIACSFDTLLDVLESSNVFQGANSDILIKDPSTQLTGIYSRAKEKGVPL